MYVTVRECIFWRVICFVGTIKMDKIPKKRKTKPIMSKKKSIKSVMKCRLAKKKKKEIPDDLTAIHQDYQVTEEHTR